MAAELSEWQDSVAGVEGLLIHQCNKLLSGQHADGAWLLATAHYTEVPAFVLSLIFFLYDRQYTMSGDA